MFRPRPPTAGGQVWRSPERHGHLTDIMKAPIRHLPLAMKGLLPTKGRTLAVMHVCGIAIAQFRKHAKRAGTLDAHVHRSQQSTVAQAYEEFDEADTMKPSADYDRIAVHRRHSGP